MSREMPDLIDRAWVMKNLFFDVDKEVVMMAPAVDAVEVVRCKECKYWIDRHVITNDGQIKTYSEMPKEAFSLLDGCFVTQSYGINVGSQCTVDCNRGYSCDKKVFRGDNDFCSRGVRKDAAD